MDYFCNHAAVVNKDQFALEKEVEMLQKTYGPWCRIRGFANYHQLFLALHLAKAKKRPFSMAFIRESEPVEGELVLKRADPSIKMYKYSDTQNLATMLMTSR